MLEKTVQNGPENVQGDALQREARREQVRQASAVTDALVASLGDPCTRKQFAWWSYHFTIDLMGHERVGELVETVGEIEAKGGLLTRSGNRRRTPGGVFFKLVKGVIGMDAWERVERKAFSACLRRNLRCLSTIFDLFDDEARARITVDVYPPPKPIVVKPIAPKTAKKPHAPPAPKRSRIPEVEVVTIARRSGGAR